MFRDPTGRWAEVEAAVVKQKEISEQLGRQYNGVDDVEESLTSWEAEERLETAQTASGFNAACRYSRHYTVTIS